MAPVLFSISPPHIWHKKSENRDWSKYLSNTSLPLHQDTSNQNLRLKSRIPAYLFTAKLIESQYDGMKDWKLELQNFSLNNHNIIKSLEIPVHGQLLSRQEWVTLSRLRTEHGLSGEMLHKWNMRDHSDCDCGYPVQSVSHIISDCPRRGFNGTIEELHEAIDNAVSRTRTLDVRL